MIGLPDRCDGNRGTLESAVISVDKVYKRYAQADTAVEVLQGVQMQVASREMVAIVGPSGAGKSTLLHLIGGWIGPLRVGSIVPELTSHSFRTGGWPISGAAGLASFSSSTISCPNFGLGKRDDARPHPTTSQAGCRTSGPPTPFQRRAGGPAPPPSRRAVGRRAAESRGRPGVDQQSRRCAGRRTHWKPRSGYRSDHTNAPASIESRFGQAFVIVTHDQNFAAHMDRVIALVDGKVSAA